MLLAFIYEGPPDFPAAFCLRTWELAEDALPRLICEVGGYSLDVVRAMIPDGLKTRLPVPENRRPLLEVWLI